MEKIILGLLFGFVFTCGMIFGGYIYQIDDDKTEKNMNSGKLFTFNDSHKIYKCSVINNY